MQTKAYFAGGCFWCVEHDLREATGVLEVTSGYAGPIGGTPVYENHHGYREAIEVIFDATKTNFKRLTQYFLDHIDPTDIGGQFYDRGESYETVIFYENDEEKNTALDVLVELDESHLYEKKIAVKVEPFIAFYVAEEEHQNYAGKNPIQYASYRGGSGRESFVNRTCAIRVEKHMKWKD